MMPVPGRADAAVKATTAPGLDLARALQASQAAVGRRVGDHVLLDRQGRPVALSSFRGKPLLVSFIYTGCLQICPATTRALQEAVAALWKSVGVSQLHVASLGFSPPAASPQALKASAAHYGITAPNWEFLTPPAAIVPALTADFAFDFVAAPAGFDHVLQVSVLDAGGRIVRQIYGEDVAAGEHGGALENPLAGRAVSPAGFRVGPQVGRLRLLV